MTLKNVINSWKLVFKDKKYILLSIIVAILFYSINVLINGYKTIFSTYNLLGISEAIAIFFALSTALRSSIELHSFVSLIATSILLGTLASLIFYKINVVKNHNTTKSGALASIGVFLAALAPGCAVCGIGLISILGLSGIIATLLPFDGLEISIFAVIILIFANWKLSKDLLVCKINKKYNKKMKGGIK